VSRIAIDIDSTLHHYWDLLDEIAQRRFGVALPYEDQRTWTIPQLPREQLHECIVETHSEENILASEPYPGAVDTVRAWHEQGHWIHITSHRAVETHDATAQWLDRIGLPWHDLHCSYDKVTRCVELEIDVLIDDSPVNLERAAEHGILGATLIHPWNADLIDGTRVIGADDWDGLRERLAPALRADAA
jgi:uncharacterized HAD superfamily protein